ncbi:MFS transporter [Maricaulis sp.]|uniref:MFS transporter n=1 Tax=Maricaulis sp. TaxID=1486257 RepID=UPI0025BCEB16|nr:MFS transporter [Maricaulis sp.]
MTADVTAAPAAPSPHAPAGGPETAIKRSTIFLHGSLALPLAVYGYPLAIWLPAHYAGQLGISLQAIGLIIMIARFTDVFTDPLMGEISDRGRTRFGRRKPYIALGAPALMVSAWFLFVPPADAGIVYFLVWLTLFFASATMIQIPFRAWGAELSSNYHARSQVTAAREFYYLTGLLMAAAVPMVIEIFADGGAVTEIFSAIWRDVSGAFTGELMTRIPTSRAALTGPVLMGLAIAIIISVPLLSGLIIATVKEPPPALRERVPMIEGFRHLWRNGPMRRVLIIAFLVIAGESLRNAVSLFFIRDIIGIPTIGAAYFLYFISGIAAIPFWLWLGKRMGKHHAFMVTLGFVSVVSACNLLLGRGDYFAFFCLFLLKGFAFGGLQFLPLAMLADVVDIDSVRSGGRRAGTYFAVLGLSEKLAAAIFTGMALGIVGTLGYQASGDLEASSAVGVLSLRLVYCLGPIALYALSVPLIWGYPLTPDRHARLHAGLARKLDRRARAAAAKQAASQ